MEWERVALSCREATPFNNHSFPEHYRSAHNLQIRLHKIIKPTRSRTVATMGGSSLLSPLHWHSFNSTRSCSQSYTGINWPLQKNPRFYSSDPVHWKFTCLPVHAGQCKQPSFHGKAGKGEGSSHGLGYVICSAESLTNAPCYWKRSKWIGKEPWADICLEFTTPLLSSYYWSQHSLACRIQF